MDDLIVEFCGAEHRVRADSTLSFGRRGELAIDENPFLHRVVGRFESVDGRWWLRNVGTAAIVSIHDRASSAVTSLPPGAASPIVYPSSAVRFQAGPTGYELMVWAAQSAGPAVTFVIPPATETIDFGIVPLTDDQQRLVIVLCEPWLRDPSGDHRLDSNRQLAARLGWTITKYNRKLDNVCDRLTRQGVRGLHRTDGRATDRREVLVRHALAASLVTFDDLSRLPS